MRTSKLVIIGAALVATFAAVRPAGATSIYVDNFSAAGTGGVVPVPPSPAYYFFIGHNASQTYTATGLTTVDAVDLTVTPVAGCCGSFNYASQPIGFTFYLNGFAIGTSTWNPGDSSAHVLNFLFASQLSGTTDWTLLMAVTQPVCSGCGAIVFGTDNPLQLTGTAVPEPAALVLLGTGLMALAVRMRRAKRN